MKQDKKPQKIEQLNEKKQTVKKISKVPEQKIKPEEKVHQTLIEPDLTQAEASSMRPPHPCPICGQRAQQNAYPFCSTRCRAIDLNRWLSGAYILPPPPQISDEEE
ncbi:DNA gyrase inhibitor YacG [Bartonella sp. 220]|uniref:DNA gyrase inhibitor YacG n=1 Tax=Bartonella sp. 220B TaxID=2967260 RepID=UPI0022A91E8C|nr:DNA gyrase inhibitor YacG [Bartonella sp. 220B]MCZ2158684.1 DNA gyrase inhibitor YacG [Bartonella sp. 220B]